MNTNCMNQVGRSIKKETVEHIGPADAARTGVRGEIGLLWVDLGSDVEIRSVAQLNSSFDGPFGQCFLG